MWQSSNLHCQDCLPRGLNHRSIPCHRFYSRSPLFHMFCAILPLWEVPVTVNPKASATENDCNALRNVPGTVEPKQINISGRVLHLPRRVLTQVTSSLPALRHETLFPRRMYRELVQVSSSMSVLQEGGYSRSDTENQASIRAGTQSRTLKTISHNYKARYIFIYKF